MRSIQSLASWRWCLLAVFTVGCAHSGAGTAAAAPGARVTEAPGAKAEASGPEARRRKEQKVRRLMALTGAEDAGKQMLDIMTEQFAHNPSIPQGFMEKFRELAEKQSMVDMLVPVYMRHLNEEDLDAAIAFHESPAGRRFLAAQPRVMEEAKEVGEQWGVRLAEQALRALAEDERRPQPTSHEGQQL